MNKNSIWGKLQPFVMSYNSPSSAPWSREVEKNVYWEPISYNFASEMYDYVRYYYI